MSGVKIYGFPVSTWTRTAVMTCIEKGIEHELVPIAYGSERHAELHPFGRIPILEHGEIVLHESLAIVTYLDAAFDGPALEPTDLLERARTRQLMSVCSDYVFRDVVRTVPRDHNPSDEQLETARTVLERVDAMIGPYDFAAARQLTLADLYLAPQVANAREKAPELLHSLEALNRWLAVIEPRASFQATT